VYDWLAKYWWALPLLLLPVLAAAIALIVPLHARRRGHGFVSWFVLQFVGMNPIYPLILVAILPNKARMRLRAEYARDLDERLRQAGVVPGRAAGAPGTGPTADRSTEGLAGPSVGDLPTRL
jgi:hypothetical protein